MKIAMCGYKGKTGSKVYQVLKGKSPMISVRELIGTDFEI